MAAFHHDISNYVYLLRSTIFYILYTPDVSNKEKNRSIAYSTSEYDNITIIYMTLIIGIHY